MLNRAWSEAECTDKDGSIPSASRRDASVVDATFCTTESSLRDSIIIYHCLSAHSASLHGRLLSARPDGLRWENIISIS